MTNINEIDTKAREFTASRVFPYLGIKEYWFFPTRFDAVDAFYCTDGKKSRALEIKTRHVDSSSYGYETMLEADKVKALTDISKYWAVDCLWFFTDCIKIMFCENSGTTMTGECKFRNCPDEYIPGTNEYNGSWKKMDKEGATFNTRTMKTIRYEDVGGKPDFV